MDRDKPPPLKIFTKDTQSQFHRLQRLNEDQPKLGVLFDEYRPWRKVRVIARDIGLDASDAWELLKVNRTTLRRPLPLVQSDGRPFSFVTSPHLLEPLSRIDRATGGGGIAQFDSPHGAFADEAHRLRLRLRTLMDEAAESSLIEGAATTRKEAVEMLRAHRQPRTHGEMMVANNYAALQFIKEQVGRELTEDMLLELQSILTKGTLKHEDEAGRYRRSDETVRVVDERTLEDIHVPPPAESLKQRIAALCQFANDDHSRGNFIHPIVKASILHFMIGYEHPFVDGNGRTARAVFYWFALRHGYSIFEYMPISERIRKGFARYPQAFVDCEQDDGDLTYFVLYKLDIIGHALDDLINHLAHEEAKLKRSEAILRISPSLNLRQRLLLEHALRHTSQRYTVKSHANSNGVAIGTARSDLEQLVVKRLMTKAKEGQEVVYRGAARLQERLSRALRQSP